ncbi:MAG: response regulator [Myxococcota bacterium]
MRLLIMDANQRLNEVIRSVVTGEGHQVMVAEGGDAALRLFRQRPADLVLGAMELGDEDGVDVLRRMRATLAGAEVDIIIMSSIRRRYDPEVQEAMAELNARDFLPQPFSVLDFVDTLRRLERQSPRNNTRRTEPGSTSHHPIRGGFRSDQDPSEKNIGVLAKLWRNRASGVLRVHSDAGMTEGWLTLKAGGPSHASDWSLLQPLLYGGELDFERAAVDGQGDWLGMGRVLFEAVRNANRSSFAEGNLYEALLCTVPVETILTLPLSGEMRRIVQTADGVMTLGELIARNGADTTQISQELYALQQLKLVALQPPLSRSPRTDSVSEAPRPAPSHRRTPHRPPRSTVTASRYEPSSLPREAHSLSATPSAAPVTRPAPRPPRTLSAISSPARKPPFPRGSTSSTRVRSMSRSRSTSRTAIRLGRTIQDPEQLRKRLGQELERLQSERPAVVLGVPADAEPRIVRAAARRMRKRYAIFAEDPSLEDEIRQMAGKLKSLVEGAYKRLRKGDNQPSNRDSGASTTIDEDMLLREGVRLISLNEWERADQILSKAHRMRIDHIAILAHLGWARFHNPTLDTVAREEEARDLLMLAAQFDPDDADTLFFLVKVLIHFGQVEDAQHRLERALTTHPADKRFRNLEQELGEHKPTGSVHSTSTFAED